MLHGRPIYPDVQGQGYWNTAFLLIATVGSLTSSLLEGAVVYVQVLTSAQRMNAVLMAPDIKHWDFYTLAALGLRTHTNCTNVGRQ